MSNDMEKTITDMMKKIMANTLKSNSMPKFRDTLGEYFLSTLIVPDVGCYETCLFHNYDSEVIVRYKTEDSEMIATFHRMTFYKLKLLLDTEQLTFDNLTSMLSDFCSTLE